MKPADFAIKHPAIITIILIALIVFGIVGLRSLRQDMFSEITLPTIMVLSVYPGVGPRDVEREVTDVLEDELNFPKASWRETCNERQ